jgi:hypothetical protein
MAFLAIFGCPARRQHMICKATSPTILLQDRTCAKTAFDVSAPIVAALGYVVVRQS